MKLIKRPLIILCILLMTTPLFSSSSERNLIGKVNDQDGKPLLGVLISLLPITPQKGEKLVTVTDINGKYNFKNLAVGKYKIAATSLDGSSFEEKTIKLDDGLTYRRDFILNLKASKSINRKTVDTDWELRSEKRDILRDEASGHSGKLPSLEANKYESQTGIKGEIKVSQESFLESNSPSSSQTEVNLSGSSGDTSNWSLAAKYNDSKDFQPTLSAIGKYRQKIWSGMNLELGADYQQYSGLANSLNQYSDPEDTWRGSLYTKNSWQVWEPFQLNCTLKYDHYNYVKSGDYLSPQVEIIYEPAEWAKMRGMFEIETISPESVYSDFSEIPTYLQGEATPERAKKYEISFEGGIGGGYVITFSAFYSDVANKQLVYMQPSGKDTGRYLYNAGDSVVKGLSFDLKKDIGSWLSGSFSYSFSKAVVLDTQRLSLYFDNLNQIKALLGEEIVHELTTKLDAEIDVTKTTVSAIYKVVIGALGTDEIESGLVDIQRLDVKIIQKLPFLAFTGTDWEIHLNVRNLLDSDGLNYFLSTEDLAGIRRKISGGVSIHF